MRLSTDYPVGAVVFESKRALRVSIQIDFVAVEMWHNECAGADLVS